MPKKEFLHPASYSFIFTEGLYQESADSSDNAKSKSLNEVLVITQNELTKEEAGLLEKILKAVQLDNKKVTKVILSAEPDTVDDIVDSSPENCAILFGLELKEICYYSPQKRGNKAILSADSLSDIMNNVNKKKMLWSALQNMFPVTPETSG